jgi:hypothetical protein
MSLLTRWLALPLLIGLFNLTAVRAQGTFLDELRIESQYEAIGDEEVPARLPYATGVPHDADDDATSLSDDRFDFLALEPDPLLNDPVNVEGLSVDSRVGNLMLDETAAYPGFEAPYPPDFDCCEAPLIRYRTTCFQGAQAAYGFIPAGDSDGLGIKTLDLLGTFAVPFGSMDHVISFTPYFHMDQLNANPSLDIPDALYDTGVKAFWKKVQSERFTTMVLFTPSVRSDFHSSEQAFKLFGMALLQWQIVPQKVSMTAGAIYTGRQDYPVLPAMGIYWTPSPLWKLDIQFPAPRLSRRLLKDGDNSETWAYLAGVFGGNTWAVKRAGGQDDQLTLRDLRLVLGVEYLLRENRGIFVETGVVFDRSMEYENTPGEISFGDSILLRAGIQF